MITLHFNYLVNNKILPLRTSIQGLPSNNMVSIFLLRDKYLEKQKNKPRFYIPVTIQMTIEFPAMATVNMAMKNVDQINLCHREILCDGFGRGNTQSCNRSLAIVRLDMVNSAPFKMLSKIDKRLVELWCPSTSVDWWNSMDNTMAVQFRNRPSSMFSPILSRRCLENLIKTYF